MAKQLAKHRYRLRYDGGEIDVDRVPFLIGRESDCQLILKGDLVSRHHAQLYETAEGIDVEDRGSLNGVFVNGVRIREPTLLAHGDLVAIGLETFEVVDSQLVPPRRSRPYKASDVDGPEPVTLAPTLGVLSAREREVFSLIVLGHTQREIGSKLHISVKTIETHRAHIAEKLHCRTRAQLVAFAITVGLLHVTP